jgi:hypothetical protein
MKHDCYTRYFAALVLVPIAIYLNGVSKRWRKPKVVEEEKSKAN